jgi:tetratricopeptide (TPR) repeat protein
VRPKTYTVAVYLVGAVLLLQAGMLVSIFWLRAMVVSVNVRLPKAKPVVVQPAPKPPPPFVGPPKPPDLLKRGPILPRLPGIATAGQAPALLSVPTNSSRLEQIGVLNDEAQILLHQNDLKSAAKVLRSAEDIDPRNPTTLKSLAETYYLLNDSVMAKEYWQRIADLGPGVGTVYALAKDHVLLLDSTAEANPLSEPSPFARAVYIDRVEKTPVETSTGQPQFHLTAVVRRKDAHVPFDQKKLQVYVIFYDQDANGQLQPDLTQHKGAFQDTLLFWNNKTRESFDVDYLMSTADPLGGDGAPATDYYGFVIGIYYDKVLQDARSEPTDLVVRTALPREIE